MTLRYFIKCVYPGCKNRRVFAWPSNCAIVRTDIRQAFALEANEAGWVKRHEVGLQTPILAHEMFWQPVSQWANLSRTVAKRDEVYH
jgi:hypothetical protein